MMTIQQMTQHVINKQNFKTLQEYEDFAIAPQCVVKGLKAV